MYDIEHLPVEGAQFCAQIFHEAADGVQAGDADSLRVAAAKLIANFRGPGVSELCMMMLAFSDLLEEFGGSEAIRKSLAAGLRARAAKFQAKLDQMGGGAGE